MRDDFAIFILTHGRANNVITAKTLADKKYSGKWYVIIDDEDEQEQEYIKRYGDRVIKFSKLEISKKFDTMDTSNNRKTIVYARNACFEIAQKLGIRYFLELDDDYTDFQFRWIKSGKLMVKSIDNIDDVFEAMIDFLIDTNAITVAFAQGGDFIGGCKGGNYKKKVLRKTMNTFFCDTKKPFNFIGRINEDVNTYTRFGSVGWLGLSITDICITQKTTQRNKGGMSETYLDTGTYLKSFYSVMGMPSAVKIGQMGDKHKRIHHLIKWNSCVPMILNEKYKKKGMI